MLVEHNHNSSCKFAEEIASYLYGEINDSEKQRFEQHLTGCQICTDELSGFAHVKSSVQFWRNEEFDTLSTPSIQIPYEQNTNADVLINQDNSAVSFITQIREFFRFSLNGMTAAGLAFVVICIGTVIIFVNFGNNPKDVAGDDKTKISNVKVISSPTIDNKNGPIENNVNTQAKSNNSRKPDNAENKTVLVTDSPKPTQISVPVNTTKSGSLKTQKSVTVNGNKPLPKTQIKSSTNKARPNLSGDDDEDDSLRLSDIFEEVSLR